MRRALVLLASLALLASLSVVTAQAETFPDVVPLPDAWQPEGVAVGRGSTYYAGSLANGAIYSGDLRTGDGGVLVPGQPGRVAVGLSFDARSGYLFVAGGLNAAGRVYDTATGAMLAELAMASGAPADFINDVIVTREAAYFTNSFAAFLYRVPLGPRGRLPDPAVAEAIPLTGDWVQNPGFNANGIEATPDGKTLIVVNSGAQAVFAVDPETGAATRIDLGGAMVPNGDGLALLGTTLYVVQNRLNQIAVIELAPDLLSGMVSRTITSADFDVPTTVAVLGSSLYAVNAKFGTPPTGTPYEIVRVPRT